MEFVNEKETNFKFTLNNAGQSYLKMVKSYQTQHTTVDFIPYSTWSSFRDDGDYVIKSD